MAEKDKKSIIIIKKKKGGAHGGAHGGAWKVAYADFVTAMMAFFLVMWLMGSDEETKAEIAHYFNHPNTPWKSGKDPESNMARPLGERNGTGDQLLSGMAGANPDDLVPNPQRPVSNQMQANAELSEKTQAALEDLAYSFEVNIDFMKFSIADESLFKEGTTEFNANAQKFMSKVGDIVKGYQGYVFINGHMDPTLSKLSGRGPSNTYEYSMAKAVAVMKYMVDEKWIAEDKVFPRGFGTETPVSQDETSRAQTRNQRIEFVLSKKRTLN